TKIAGGAGAPARQPTLSGIGARKAAGGDQQVLAGGRALPGRAAIAGGTRGSPGSLSAGHSGVLDGAGRFRKSDRRTLNSTAPVSNRPGRATNRLLRRAVLSPRPKGGDCERNDENESSITDLAPVLRGVPGRLSPRGELSEASQAGADAGSAEALPRRRARRRRAVFGQHPADVADRAGVQAGGLSEPDSSSQGSRSENALRARG